LKPQQTHLRADSKQGRNSVLLLPEQLDIKIMNRESEPGESTWKMVRDILSPR